MLDLEERVRDQLRSAVDDQTPSARLDELVLQRVRRRVRQRLRRQRLQATVMVIAVLGVAVAGVAAIRGDDRAPSVVAGTADDGSQNDGALFLVPDVIPEGFELVTATGGDQPGVSVDDVLSSEWDRTLRFVRFDAAHERPVELIDVQWGPGSAEAGGDAADVEVRGRDGRYSADQGWLEWDEPGGPVVRVSARVARHSGDAAVTPLSEDLLRAVAESVEPTGTGGFRLAEPPDGFEMVADWPGRASEGTNPRSAVYAAVGGRAFQIHIVDDTELPPGINLDSTAARLVEVRGHDAVLTPALSNPPDGFDAGLFLQWIDLGDARVTLGGTGLDESALLDIARTLHEINEDTWFGLQASRSDQSGPATTHSGERNQTSETPAPDTGDEAPTGSSESAQPIHVEGSYQGTEHYSPTTGGCPDLDHVLVSTFELEDGSTWQYRSEYCGTLDGNHWTGAGTFEFTTPDGDTISGTTSSEAQVPSPGVPLVLVITGGSGAYDGAAGSCDLDNHVTQVDSGTQDQYGTFTCDIVPSPSP
jgi:hypothetical protein